MSLKTLQQTSISHTSALELVQQAQTVAAGMGIAIAACVVDVHGRVKAKLVMDGAALIADELVERKARTALLGMASGDFGQAVQNLPVISQSMLQLPAITMLGGGFPLLDDGKVVGAFAIGGGTVQQDIDCARQVLAPLGLA